MKKRLIILIILIILSIGIGVLNTYLYFSKVQSLQNSITAIENNPPKIDYQKINDLIIKELAKWPKPKDGKNGNDGKDGLDGKDGKSGKNGNNGHDVTPEEIAAAVTAYLQQHPPIVNDGKTPILRCNTSRNEWEVRYDPTESWQLLNNQVVPCKVTQ